MVIDMTNDLAPILWGTAALSSISGLSTLFAGLHTAWRRPMARRGHLGQPRSRKFPRQILDAGPAIHRPSCPAHA
jgi:hypothetical protein